MKRHATSQSDGKDVVAGILRLLRGQEASPEALAWTAVCTKSAACVPACPEAARVTDSMFIVAARALAACATEQNFADELIYPPQSRIFDASIYVAERVTEYVFDEGIARVARPADVAQLIQSKLYKPFYQTLSDALPDVPLPSVVAKILARPEVEAHEAVMCECGAFPEFVPSGEYGRRQCVPLFHERPGRLT